MTQGRAETGAHSVAALVEQARKALAGELPDVPGAEDEPAVHLGSAADGLVRAEVSSTGRVRALSIDPQLFSQPLADVAQAARTAINAALDSRPGSIDYSALVDEVRSMQEQARQQLTAIAQGMAEVAQHVADARGARTNTAATTDVREEER